MLFASGLLGEVFGDFLGRFDRGLFALFPVGIEVLVLSVRPRDIHIHDADGVEGIAHDRGDAVAGIVFLVDITGCDKQDNAAELVQRAVAVERSSWKGREGSGLAEPSFAAFYLDMAERLAPSGRLRAGFARLDGRDVGFILGAVRSADYRGLQLAYAAAAAPLSLGNLLQLGQLERLAAEGIERYDLGQDMPYKAAWSDEVFVTETVVLKT